MQKHISIFVVLSFVVVALSQDESRLVFNLFATDLNGCDSLSACDASVKVYCTSTQSDWSLCGRTAKKQDDNFPVWDEIFNFTHSTGNNERWRFDVVDEDLLFDEEIGSVTVNVDEYANITSNIHRMALGTRGFLSIQRRRT